jgi:hypothetical protein
VTFPNRFHFHFPRPPPWTEAKASVPKGRFQK